MPWFLDGEGVRRAESLLAESTGAKLQASPWQIVRVFTDAERHAKWGSREARHRTRELVSVLYGARSRYVHTGDVPTKWLSDQTNRMKTEAFESMNELLRSGREVVRRALLRLMSDLANSQTSDNTDER